MFLDTVRDEKCAIHDMRHRRHGDFVLSQADAFTPESQVWYCPECERQGICNCVYCVLARTKTEGK